MEHTVSIVVMAAGNSTRFVGSGVKVKKQWLCVGDNPLWLHVSESLVRVVSNSFARSSFSGRYSLDGIFVVSSSADLAYMTRLSPRDIDGVQFQVVLGGDTRQKSLLNAVRLITSDFVLVNDCARFNVDSDAIDRVILAMNDHLDCVVPSVSVYDTATCLGDELKYLDRGKLRLVQTPQFSRTGTLRAALEFACSSSVTFGDESSAIHEFGGNVTFVSGSDNLKKLTYQHDLPLLYQGDDVFVGIGSDVHAFVCGKDMYLCGVKIEEGYGFDAHSDGDVAIHSLVDAILGAMNRGDIGDLFPDTDKSIAGMDSRFFLSQVYEYALSVGFVLFNVDLSILAQRPRISPYRESMRDSISSVLGVPRSRVSIKASTTEGLGFVGRGEGVYAQAIVGLKRMKIKKEF